MIVLESGVRICSSKDRKNVFVNHHSSAVDVIVIVVSNPPPPLKAPPLLLRLFLLHLFLLCLPSCHLIRQVLLHAPRCPPQVSYPSCPGHPHCCEVQMGRGKRDDGRIEKCTCEHSLVPKTYKNYVHYIWVRDIL